VVSAHLAPRGRHEIGQTALTQREERSGHALIGSHSRNLVDDVVYVYCFERRASAADNRRSVGVKVHAETLSVRKLGRPATAVQLTVAASVNASSPQTGPTELPGDLVTPCAEPTRTIADELLPVHERLVA